MPAFAFVTVIIAADEEDARGFIEHGSIMAEGKTVFMGDPFAITEREEYDTIGVVREIRETPPKSPCPVCHDEGGPGPLDPCPECNKYGSLTDDKEAPC